VTEVTTAPQALVTVKGTFAPHWVLPGSVLTTILSGQVIRLETVTVNVHCAVLFDWSVAVRVTTVVPTGNVLPETGLATTVAVPQASVAVGMVKLTTAEHCPASGDTLMFAGQVICGDVRSLTVKLVMQVD